MRARNAEDRMDLDLNVDLGTEESHDSYETESGSETDHVFVENSEEDTEVDDVGSRSPNIVVLGDEDIAVEQGFCEPIDSCVDISSQKITLDDVGDCDEHKEEADQLDRHPSDVGNVECNQVSHTGNLRSDKPGSPNSSNPDVHGTRSVSNTICNEIEKRLIVGSTVSDLEQAYLLYCEYGRCIGFGVRRGEQRYFGKSNDIKWKEYLCSCAGIPDSKASAGRVANFKKLLLRTGCKAKIRLSRTLDQPWRVSIFENEHNHGLVPSEMTHLLRSSRNLSYANKAILEHSAGIGVSAACEFMERESGGPQNLGFTRQDAYDHLKHNKRQTKIENGDATALIEHFINKSNEDPFFYWKVQLDDDHRIMNFFYRDSQCARDYHAFDDLLSVDTTYRTNTYNLICAPFVGINHHTFNVMFGMAFLSDETTATFEWLFRSFLESMNGVEPEVVFTDQCKAMMNAIDNIFPNSKHRLCQWHINKNATAKFGSRLNGNAAFKKMWHRCMNEVETEKEFDTVWEQMIDNHKLRGKPWFDGMHALRHRWASVFTRDTFTVGLLATSRSEATNRVLKKLHRRNLGLFEFVCNCDEIITKWRRKETEEDTYGIWKPGQFVSDNDLSSQAASVYTRNVYKWFEFEATKSLNIVLSHDTVDLGEDKLEFTATHHKGSRDRKVIFNKKNHYSTCSCRMWESEGIFCRHILKVYSFMNVFSIPESQILKRWTKKAKQGLPQEIRKSGFPSTLPSILFVNTVMRTFYNLASACIENEAAQALLIQKLESLSVEVYRIVGEPQVKTKRKVLSDLKCDAFDPEGIRDPQRILERGFTLARNARHGGFLRKKGKCRRRNTNKPPTPFMPRVPSEMMEKSTTPTKMEGDESPRWKLRNHSCYHNSSQP